MTSENLKSKTVKALAWSLAESVGQRGVQFIIGIVLARLLLPEQFGLIAMLSVFMAIAQTFLDSGFGAALVQKKEISEEDTSSIFYFNIFIGFIAAICLCGIAPFVAAFYQQPALVQILRVMALVLIINALWFVPFFLLIRSIDFKTQTKVTFIAGILSGVIGIIFACRSFGVWSLVAQQIANASFRVVLFWIFCKWRPTLLFSLRSLKEMFGFGSKLLASGLLNTIFDNAYLIIIGKLFSPADLGYFTRANTLQQIPSQTLSWMIVRVTFPVFSSIQEDRERLKRGMKKALTTMVLINFPLMIGLAVVAESLIQVLLTEKWLPAVPYFQILCIVGLMFPLHLINLNVLQAMGRSDLFLRVEIIKKILIVINIVLTWHLGILAMITGQVVVSMFSYYLNAYYNKKLLDYSIWEQIKDLSPYLFVAALMGGAIYFLNYLPLNAGFALLACQAGVGCVVYVVICQMLRLRAFIDLREVLLHRFTS